MINGVSFHLLRKLWTNYIIYILPKNKTTSYTCAFMWYNNDCKVFPNIITINGYTTKIDALVTMWSDLHCLHNLYVFSGTCWKLNLNFIWFQFIWFWNLKERVIYDQLNLNAAIFHLCKLQSILQNHRRVYHYFDYICILR